MNLLTSRVIIFMEIHCEFIVLRLWQMELLRSNKALQNPYFSLLEKNRVKLLAQLMYSSWKPF